MNYPFIQIIYKFSLLLKILVIIKAKINGSQQDLSNIFIINFMEKL